MNRRSFLKGAAFVAASVAAKPLLASPLAQTDDEAPLRVAHDFSFGPDGSFTLLQFTDTHHIIGDPLSRRALDCVQEALDGVRPDLVIHTGDILFGKPDRESALEVLQLLADSGIPWAVALGNHDSQFGSTRKDMFDAILSLPGCVNLPPKEGVYGCSNDVFRLFGPQGVERAFYLFDTMDAVILKGEEEIHCYDYIRHSQIGWYRSHSEQLTRENGGQPVPSLAFFHIPLREIEEALVSGTIIGGTNGEPPCPSRLNSGLLAQFREMGDVKAIVTGHDHDNDYVLDAGYMYYIYGRYSGGDTVYNHLGREGYIPSDGSLAPGTISGCRVFRFQEGQSGFETYVRLFGGEIQQRLELLWR